MAHHKISKQNPSTFQKICLRVQAHTHIIPVQFEHHLCRTERPSRTANALHADLWWGPRVFAATWTVCAETALRALETVECDTAAPPASCSSSSSIGTIIWVFAHELPVVVVSFAYKLPAQFLQGEEAMKAFKDFEDTDPGYSGEMKTTAREVIT